jgi:hypothetical protein
VPVAGITGKVCQVWLGATRTGLDLGRRRCRQS